MAGYTLFDTAVGTCGIGWTDAGVATVGLPATPARLQACLTRRLPSAGPASPPPSVRSAVDRIVALTHGEFVDLTDVVLDLEGVPLADREVYVEARAVPVIVPCHRVVAADGSFGGFSAPGGVRTKLALLAAEGAVLPLG